MSADPDWFETLRERAAAAHLPERSELTAAEEAQCRIVGGAFIAWFHDAGRFFVSQRAALANVTGQHGEPAIVLVSNAPGLVAAREIFAESENRPFAVTPQIYASVVQRADPEFRWHIQVASYFRVATGEFAKRARQRFLLREGEVFWEHYEATISGPLAAQGGSHLWKWNGVEPELLEEGFETWVS